MPDNHHDETSVRGGALLVLLVVGAIPILVSAFDGNHWDTYARWYGLPTALVVAARLFLRWFRTVAWRVVGAGALYLAVAAGCSVVLAWWNWMAFVTIAVLATLLVVLLGRHALGLLIALGAEGIARFKRAWARWRAERKRDRTGEATDSTLHPGGLLPSPEAVVPEQEVEPDPGDEASGDRRSNTPEESHSPRSRLGRLADSP